MKKLLVGLLAAILMSAGLVGFSGSPANAAKCPYSGCVKTRTVGVAISAKGSRQAYMKAKVRVRGSDVVPTGKVRTIVVKKKKNGNVKRVARLTGNLDKNGVVDFNLENLRKGKYIVIFKFKGNQAAGFANSQNGAKFRIRGKLQ